jgi:hypothetical protein
VADIVQHRRGFKEGDIALNIFDELYATEIHIFVCIFFKYECIMDGLRHNSSSRKGSIGSISLLCLSIG